MGPLDDVPEQSPYDIYNKGVDESKCIAGRCKLVWDLKTALKKVEALVLVLPPVGTGQPDGVFKVSFELDDEALAALNISPSDEFRLSLRGAKLEKLRNIEKLCSLSMRLVFSQGVHVQWKRPGQTLLTLNTWIRTSTEASIFSIKKNSTEAIKLRYGLYFRYGRR